MSHLEIQFLSGPAGSGKTYSRVEKTIKPRIAAGHKIILSQPNKALIRETSDRFNGHPLHPCKVIDGDNYKRPAYEIQAYSNKPYSDGHVLNITHSGLDHTPNFYNKEEWDLEIDEVPKVEARFAVKLPETHEEITAHLTLGPDHGGYSELLAGNHARLVEIGENRAEDEIKDVVSNIASYVVDDNWACHVRTKTYNDLLENEGDWLIVHAIRRPDSFAGYKSVTVLAANFECSLFYKIMRVQGVSFQALDTAKASLQYQSHENGSLFEIAYAYERRWSNKLREDYPVYLDRLVAAVKAEFQNSPFLWSANKVIPEKLFLPPAIRLSGSPHGLNSYKHIDRVAYLSALNPPKDHYEFLEWFGVSPNDVWTAIAVEGAYQAIMRCSGRDPSNTNRKHIIVPDRDMAEAIQRLLPGSTVRSLGIPLEDQPPPINKGGRPGQYANDAERKKASRERQAAKLLAKIKLIRSGIGTDIKRKIVSLDDSCHETTIDTLSSKRTQFRCSIWPDLFELEPDNHVISEKAATFIDHLKSMHKEIVTDKAKNKLLCISCFDKNKAEDTSKGRDNVVFCNGIMLDNDYGGLTHNQFAGLFPHLEMVVYNSFSSTPSKPKWRVYIPVTEAFDADSYLTVTKAIMKEVENHGYFKKDNGIPGTLLHGFDQKRLGPEGLFYLPCQAGSQQKGASFFKHYRGELRQPLDPVQWIMKADFRENVGISPGKLTSVEGLTPDQRREYDSAINRWRSEGSLRGKGNDEFYVLGQRLADLGLSEDTTKDALRSEFIYAHTPKDREAQIPFIISSLRQYGRFAVA